MNIKNRFHYIILMIVALWGGACDVINPEEEIPAYIQIEPFQLTTDYAEEGSASQKITDAWVFVNSEFLGVYYLPATFPVLANGESDILVLPGVKVNGIAASPAIYPFYERFTTTENLTPSEVSTIRPVTEYLESTIFSINNFDIGHTFTEDFDGDTETRVVLTEDPQEVFEGSASGKIVLDTFHPAIEVGTNERFVNLPTNGFKIFIEMNYQAETDLVLSFVGFDSFGNSFPGASLFLKPNTAWNKVYYDATEIVLIASDVSTGGFRILLGARLERDRNGEYPIAEARILIDNIKLVFFDN